MGHMRHIGGIATEKKMLSPRNQVAAAAFSLVGTTVDCKDFSSLLAKVEAGPHTGTPDSLTVDAKLQESADDSSWSDVAVSVANPAVAIAQITAQNTRKFLTVDTTVLKRYVRLLFTVAFVNGTSPTVGLQAGAVAGGFVNGKPTHA